MHEQGMPFSVATVLAVTHIEKWQAGSGQGRAIVASL